MAKFLLLPQTEDKGVIKGFFQADSFEGLKEKVNEQMPSPPLKAYLEEYGEPKVPVTPFTLVDESRFCLLIIPEED